MKKKYTIGEVSEIMGISAQTLRYYNSIDLLKPEYVNPDTGYRYYSDDQFHFLDRIKYLQKLGMSLNEIKEILVNNDIRSLIARLDELEVNCQKQISSLEDQLDSIRWYRDYFSQSNEDNEGARYSRVTHYPARYLVSVRIREGEKRENYHVRLTSLRNRPHMKDLPYMRQYSMILSYDDIMRMKYRPLYLGMFIKSTTSDFLSDPYIMDNIIEIPEGDYFCFRQRILSEGWNPYLPKMFFSDNDKTPGLVLANEYEDSLTEYSSCPYEIQILIE